MPYHNRKKGMKTMAYIENNMYLTGGIEVETHNEAGLRRRPRAQQRGIARGGRSVRRDQLS